MEERGQKLKREIGEKERARRDEGGEGGRGRNTEDEREMEEVESRREFV